MKTCIYWHRNDLRIHDNECLHNATQHYDEVIPIYIIDPKHYIKLKFGFRKTGIIRYRYLCKTLIDLRQTYLSIGGNLLIRYGDPQEIISGLAKQYRATTIITQKEIASEELDRELQVKDAIAGLDVELNLIWGRTLYHKDDIPYTRDKIPLTSKAFRLNVTKSTQVRDLIPSPSQISCPDISDWGDIPHPSDIGYSYKELDMDVVTTYPAGETKALERLQYYTFDSELLTSYKWTRNRSLGLDYSSKLSPYLALGSLSPRMIYHEVKRYEREIKKNISTWWLIFEVVWRDFFTYKSWRVGNSMFNSGGIRDKDVTWSYDKALYKRWIQGNTGIPFIDAHQKELLTTGFMSNRGRVNSASFFTRDYQIDWRWGAAWFEHCLIDYDVYVNWMNWHTQAFDIYYTNPVHQSMKYDKDGKFILRWLPQLQSLPHKDFHAPWLHSDTELKTLGIKDYQPPAELYKKWNRSINNIIKERK